MPRAAVRAQHSARPTAEQARAELQRRRLPRDRRHEGRGAAEECGSFYLSKAELQAIAEGAA